MKISTKGRYAVRVMAEIAMHNGEFVSIAELAQKQGISVKYLEQIVAKLTKNHLLVSLRGATGGYKLNMNAKDCTIADILQATNDMPNLVPCLKYNADCPRKDNCYSIGCWETLSKIIYDYLKSVSLQDLIDKNKNI